MGKGYLHDESQEYIQEYLCMFIVGVNFPKVALVKVRISFKCERQILWLLVLHTSKIKVLGLKIWDATYLAIPSL